MASLQWQPQGKALSFGVRPRPFGGSLAFVSGSLFAAGGWPTKADTGATSARRSSLPPGTSPSAVDRRRGTAVADDDVVEIEPDRLQGRFTISRVRVLDELPGVADGSLDLSVTGGGPAATMTATGEGAAATGPGGADTSAVPPLALDKLGSTYAPGGPLSARIGGEGLGLTLASQQHPSKPVSLIVTAAADRASHVTVASPAFHRVLYFGGESVVFGDSGRVLDDVIVLNAATSTCRHHTRARHTARATEEATAAAAGSPGRRGGGGGAAGAGTAKRSPSSGRKTPSRAADTSAASDVAWPCGRRHAAGALARMVLMSDAAEGELSSRIAKSNLASAKAKASPRNAKASPRNRKGGRNAAADSKSEVAIVIGGQTAGGDLLNDVWRFRFDTMEWMAVDVLGEPPTARMHHALSTTSAGGHVVMFGGHDGTARLNDVHVLTLDTRTWAAVPTVGDVPAPRCWHSSVLCPRDLDMTSYFLPLLPKPEPDDSEEKEAPSPSPPPTGAKGSKKKKAAGGKSSTPVPPPDDWSWLPPDRLLVFGGSGPDPMDDTLYTLYLATREWRRVGVAGESPVRYGHSMLHIPLPDFVGYPATDRPDARMTFGFPSGLPAGLSPSQLFPSPITALSPSQRRPEYRFPPMAPTDVGQHHIGVPLDLRSLTQTFSVELEPIGPDTFRQLTVDDDAAKATAEEEAGRKRAKDAAMSTKQRKADRAAVLAASRTVPRTSSKLAMSARKDGAGGGGGGGGGGRASAAGDDAGGATTSAALPSGWSHTFLVFGGRETRGPTIQPVQLSVVQPHQEWGSGEWDRVASDEDDDGLGDFAALANGDEYRGEFNEDGVRHGYGECLFRDGGRYIGDWADDMREGRGDAELVDGSSYSGQWAADRFDGVGTWTAAPDADDGADDRKDDADTADLYAGHLTSRSAVPSTARSPRTARGVGVPTQPVARGQTATPRMPSAQTFDAGVAALADWTTGQVEYSGEWCDGERYGDGRARFADGREYSGMWAHNAPVDAGAYTYPDGSGWKGNWVKGVLQGQGFRRCADGEVYKGNFVDGQRHGKGTANFSDGSVYKGQWRSNRRNGPGECRFASQLVYVGKWVADLPNGRGRCTYPSGHTYDGMWRNGLRHGYGQYVSKDGTEHHGEWRNDRRHGPGVETRPDGSVLRGEWAKGEFSVMHFHGEEEEEEEVDV